jgi:hypothetical protein
MKYPRSFHLPWSEGATDDDKTLNTTEHFVGQEVVVTEKLDGENTTVYSDGYMHARSLDSKSHESQAWVRALAAQVAHDMPAGWRICGENLYARHSLGYDRLASYFYVFAIYDEDNRCLSWEETVEWAALLGLKVVPVLYEGEWDEAAVKACYDGSSQVGDEGEGYVVRVADSFDYDDFSSSLAKFVRKGHVQTGAKHWRSCAVVPNGLGA